MRIKPFKYINGVLHYQCNVCKGWFDKSGFYKEKRYEIGITSSCKSCHKKTSVRTRNLNKAKERDAISRSKRQQQFKAQFKVQDLENEIWKAIPETNNSYFISNFGRVKSKKWGKEILLKIGLSQKGYSQVCINYLNKRKNRRVHRLVAQAFIPNPSGYVEINHKDEIKTNNRVDNLEWCDRKYNMGYGTWKERRKTNNIKMYSSTTLN